jgi:peptidoglycan/LPS O-acetylase OafA/YrhL
VKRQPGLDLIRTIAIVLVLLRHAALSGLGLPMGYVGLSGWMGVDLFFVLSGYLIGSQFFQQYIRGKTPAVGSFYLRRAFRILPAYWAILGLYFCFPTLREDTSMQSFWRFVTFTENLFFDSGQHQTFAHAWSLCVEEHFYLVFPLLVWALMRRPSWKKAVIVCLSILATGIALRAFAWLHELRHLPDLTNRYLELIYYPTPMRLDGLMAGVLLAAIRCFRPGWWERLMDHPYKVLAAGTVGLIGAIWLTRHRMSFEACVFGFPAISFSVALITAACVSPKCLLGTLRVPGVRATAAITFSLYLCHMMAWQAVKTYLPAWVAHRGVQSFVIFMTAAFLAATLLYLLVERPFLLLRDRLDGQARPAAPA